MKNSGKVKIFRCDPLMSQDIHYDTYDNIPFENLTVLNVLNYIYNERDPSLSFRGNLCSKGFCGGCAIMVNGKPCMACHYLAMKEMIIEPHPRFKIVKDLVCDWEQLDVNSSLLEKIKKPYPIITIDPEKCVNCNDCVVICPAAVYEIVEKKVAVTHIEGCLGRSCRLCSDACWKSAISLED